MRSYSNKFEVTFVLGKVSATVSLPLRDITTWDIIKYLNFSTEQQSSIIITGLMDLKTKQIIPMKKHETLHRLGFIEDPRERLKNGATYQVMIEGELFVKSSLIETRCSRSMGSKIVR